jgi:hypothetical protein
MSSEQDAGAAASKLFLPSKQAAVVISVLCFVALSLALYLRYAIIQNAALGVACEAGQESLICKLRLAVIMLFVQEAFGWAALIAAGVQLWRPNAVTFGFGLVFALLGLVLYNTRVSALAVALLVLSLARAAPEGR